MENIKQGCVLLVEDEEAVRESLKELLELFDFQVYAVRCVDHAIKILEEQQDIEAIVSDLKMPGKMGIDTLRYLNSKERNIPVIFLTGWGTMETCQEALKEGAFDYILKPIENKDKVLFPLKQAIERYRLEKNNEELELDVLRMAEQHEKLLDSILSDVEIKNKVQEKIATIIQKWEKKKKRN
ncbi:MAG: response regulator [Candidatus Omnitrophica bacterium]|nr:response regulator [Candidatus Omnitrophota bacterium]